MSVFDIHEDITRARTIGSAFYSDPDFYESSLDKIFARSWQFVCPALEVNNLRPHLFLEGSIDEPLLFSKAGQDRIRCVSNVCTHRGAILVESPCKADLIRCGYHGRRFTLDGKFLSMPEFEGVKDFPTDEDDLNHVQSAVWNGILLCSLDPMHEIELYMEGLDSPLAGFDFQALRFVSAKDYYLNAHWALYCENYVEGFHIPYVHPGLNREVDYGSYKTELFRFSSVQTARSGSEGESEPESPEPFANGVAALYCFVFPNLMLNFYPWGLSVNIVQPLGPARTRVRYLTYVSDETKTGKGAGTDLDMVELEDQAVVESVQQGIRSRFYDSGRYSPERETGTHHFHRLIAEFLTEG